MKDIKSIYYSFISLCSLHNKNLIKLYLSDLKNLEMSTLQCNQKYGLTKNENFYDTFERIIPEENFDLILSEGVVSFKTQTTFINNYTFNTYFSHNVDLNVYNLSFHIFNKNNSLDALFVSFSQNVNNEIIFENNKNNLSIPLKSFINSNFSYDEINLTLKFLINNYDNTSFINDFLNLYYDLSIENDNFLKSIIANSYIYQKLVA